MASLLGGYASPQTRQILTTGVHPMVVNAAKDSGASVTALVDSRQGSAVFLAVVDFIWAVVLTKLYGRPAMSVWNGVASAAFGPDMLTAGWKGVAIGIAMHCTVATTWSTIFVTAETKLKSLLAA